MTGYAGMTSDSPWPMPVPAMSVAVGTRPARPVTRSGTVGEAMHTRSTGARVIPVASIAAGTPQPVSRAAAGSANQVGAVATPPQQAPPSPTAAPPAPIHFNAAGTTPIRPTTEEHPR